MAKTPAKKKTLTQADKLADLKAKGFVNPSVKTFNKSVRKTWADFNAAFPTGRVFRQATLLTGSKEFLSAAKSVNMLVVGDRVVFPAGNTKVTVRETATRIFIYQRRHSGHKDTIILGKDGNHLKAGLEYSKSVRTSADKKGVMRSWGSLKTHAVTTKNGEVINGFMRDVAQTYENPIDAMLDHRYLVDSDQPNPGDYLDDFPEFLARTQKTNGISALILTEY